MKTYRKHRTTIGHSALAGILFSLTPNLLDAAPPQGSAAPRSHTPTDVEMPSELGEVIRETLRKGQFEIIPVPAARAAERPEGFTAHEARNRRHGFHASFGDAGLQLRPLGSHDYGWKFGLSLVSVGFEGDPRDVAAPVLTTRENTIEFHRQNLVEWYVNDDFGVEQGFTLNSPPPRSFAGSAASEVLEVRLELTGNLSAELTPSPLGEGWGEGQTVLLRDQSGVGVLRVKDLFAFDATGRHLSAEFVLNGLQLVLLVDTRAAVYPVTIDPLIVTEQAKLTAGEGAAAGDQLGNSVAISSDTALVGVVGDDSFSGSAYVFIRSGTVWNYQAKLTASDAATSDQFGSSVALASDTALVGADADDGPAGANQGSAYVFVRGANNVWDNGSVDQQAKLTASDAAANDIFGNSVAISGDTALVGAPQDDDAGPSSGSAYVFVRGANNVWDNGSLDQQAKLTASSDGAVGDLFGRCVALSGDTALVGAYGDDGPAGFDQGSAYVFVRGANNVWDNGSFDQQAKLTASDAAANDVFGVSVHLSDDTALVGAFGDDGPAGLDQGSAYVFVRGANNVWDNGSVDQQAKLTASDAAANDIFGYSVAISGDTALVGARNDGDGAAFGSAYLFVRGANNVWDNGSVDQQAKLTASDAAASDQFGSSVAINGDTVLVGAFGDDGPLGSNQGSAFVFVRGANNVWDNGSLDQQAKLAAGDAAADDEFGSSVALSGDTALVGAPRDDDGGSSSGSAYVFVRSGTAWGLQAKLTASDAAGGDLFGTSVAISGDTALVGAPFSDAAGETNRGVAYVFVRGANNVWDNGSLDQQAQLTGTGAIGPGGQFGYSVALSGNTALVGMPHYNPCACITQGAAYVFVKPGDGWSNMTQTAKLLADDFGGDEFGISVALDGDTALVGAPLDDDAGTSSGSAYVFVRGANNVWDNGSVDQQAKLTAGDHAAGDEFGFSVALDGDTALVGAYGDDDGGLSSGSAYMFVRGANNVWDNGSLDQQVKLAAGDPAAGDEFGSSVALSGDTALVGAPLDDDGGSSGSGSAYVFVRGANNVWDNGSVDQQAKLTASDAAGGDFFGTSVAISGDTALVGAYLDDGPAGADQGSAYVFTIIDECECRLYGDVVAEFCLIDVDDLLCVLDDFVNTANCAGDGDIFPCDPDGTAPFEHGDGINDVDDITAVLQAFVGFASCPDPCPP